MTRDVHLASIGVDHSDSSVNDPVPREPRPVEQLVAILVVSQLFFLPLDFGEVGLTNEGRPDVIRLGLLSLGGLLPILPIVFLDRPRPRRPLSPATAALTLWLVWAGLGLFTSVDVRQTALAIAFMTGNVVGFTWFLRRFGRRAVASAHVIMLSAFITIGLSADFLLGFDGGRADGLSPSINGFAITAVLLLVWTMILRRFQPELWQFAPIAIAVVAILASGSRAAIISMLLTALVLGKRPKPSVLVPGVAALAVLVVLVSAIGILNLERPSNGGEETIVTLTGRSNVWARAVDLVEDRPIAGYGMRTGETIWTNEYLRTRVNFEAGNAHNSWLEVAVSTGLVGVGLFASAMVLAAAALWKKRDREMALLAMLVLFMLGLSEAIIDGASLGFIQLVVICAGAQDFDRDGTGSLGASIPVGGRD